MGVIYLMDLLLFNYLIDYIEGCITGGACNYEVTAHDNLSTQCLWNDCGSKCTCTVDWTVDDYSQHNYE